MDFEAALREACVEADKTYWETFFERMDSMPDIIIPEDKDNRLREFIRNYKATSGFKKKNRKGMTRGFKALLIAAIILMVAAFTAFAFSPVKSYFIEIYNDGTKFIFLNEKKKDYFYSTFTYIPEGYELTQHTKGKLSQRSVYNNGNKIIHIDTNTNKGSVTFIDTENAETGEVVINGCDGYYSITDDAVILIWTTGKYHHCITADLNEDIITLDEVIKIAESRQPLK